MVKLSFRLQWTALGRPGHLGYHVAPPVDRVQPHICELALIHCHKMAGKSAQGTIPRLNNVRYERAQVEHRLLYNS